MDGFGEKSWQRLWDTIQRSRNTTFERYLISMDIPIIGNTASRELCRVLHGSLAEFEARVDSGYDFTQLADFGDTLHSNIHNWFKDEQNRFLWEQLQMNMNIEKREPVMNETMSGIFAGKTIVVTSKVEPTLEIASTPKSLRWVPIRSVRYPRIPIIWSSAKRPAVSSRRHRALE